MLDALPHVRLELLPIARKHSYLRLDRIDDRLRHLGDQRGVRGWLGAEERGCEAIEQRHALYQSLNGTQAFSGRPW